MSVEGTSPEKPPRTAVMVLTHNGRDHLEACFESLRRLDGFTDGQPGRPHGGAHRDDVWLVDNGSEDGSADLVSSRFPWVRVLSNRANLGFPLAYNLAAAAVNARWVVFLNDDTRVAPGFLSALHRARETHGDPFAVAARMMSWDGSRVDFAGADTYFTGHAWQRGLGEPAAGRSFPEERLLFGCAGALMLRRKTFLDIGGFDPDYFSFFEDVDLGWRATLLGHETWLAPEAVAYHAHHASWGQQPRLRVVYLTERNALLTVFKNFHEERMGVLLLLAAALTFLRCWHSCDRLRLRREPFLTSAGVAHLLALAELPSLLPALRERRALVQAARTRSDAELLPLFGAFASPPDALGEDFRRLRRALAARAGIRDDDAGGPFPAEVNAAAERAALALAELCRGALAGRTAPAFLAEDWDPTWEHELSPAAASSLRDAALAVERLAAAPLAGETIAAFAAALDRPVEPARRTGQVSVRRMGTIAAASDRPAVSVVVRTKDRPDRLRSALASLAAQLSPPAEAVVVNDGGADVAATAAEFAGRFPVVLVDVPGGGGRSRAAQAGLEAASGTHVLFLDDDDELRPEHVRTLADAIARQGARVAYSDVECVSREEDGSGAAHLASRGTLGGPFDASRLPFENTIPIMAVLAERALVLEVGGFDPALEYFEDWDLWLRLARRAVFHHCPVATAVYHLPPDGAGGGLTGDHRWPHLARIFDRHRESVRGVDWARFYQRHVEATRLRLRAAEDGLARAAAERDDLAARLRAVERSRGWRLVQWARRLLGRR